MELLGYASAEDYLYLVYEYVSNGSLGDHLHDPLLKGIHINYLKMHPINYFNSWRKFLTRLAIDQVINLSLGLQEHR